MASPFLGEIRCFGFNFAPVGWAKCNGQLLAISSNDALFAILGTTYGGDGQTTFGLPNLQGQVPMHWGSGPSGFNTTIGEVQGVTTVTLTTAQIPAHTARADGRRESRRATNSSAPPAPSITDLSGRVSDARCRLAGQSVVGRSLRLRRNALSTRRAARSRTTTCSLIWR